MEAKKQVGQYMKRIQEQEDSLDMMSGKLAKMCQCFGITSEYLKSEVVDSTTFQTLQVQVTELKSENEGLKLLVEELTKARELVEITLRQRDKLVSTQCEKMRFSKEQYETFHEEMGDKLKHFDEEKKVFETKISNLENVLSQLVKDFLMMSKPDFKKN
ncbi:hypothetical protein Tco_0514445 [Tanacetum coccineum]